jgi:hypothetical protein
MLRWHRLTEVVDPAARKGFTDLDRFFILELTLAPKRVHDRPETLRMTHVTRTRNDYVVANYLNFFFGGLFDSAYVLSVAKCGRTISANDDAVRTPNRYKRGHLFDEDAVLFHSGVGFVDRAN